MENSAAENLPDKNKKTTEEGAVPVANFIRDIIREDLKKGKWQKVVTRFPPEPNGYLHIGHAKAICIDFGMAAEHGGECHLRFDDTNPAKEEQEYIRAIQEDIKWLGFDWGDHLYYASDYFEQMYHWAIELIKAGKPMWMISVLIRSGNIAVH